MASITYHFRLIFCSVCIRIIYLDNTTLKIDKCVAGIYTNLASNVFTYTSGATLKFQTRLESGNLKVRVFYNNVLNGSEVSINDAGIISNQIHGLFSTINNNLFDNFNLYASGGSNEYSIIDSVAI